MAKEWPPQNTGRFAPPSCASCCSGPPPEATAQFFFVDVYPLLEGLSYTIEFTPQERDLETEIVGVGRIIFVDQVSGDLPDCSGCYGSACIDDEGNPIPPYYGSPTGWLQTTTTHAVEFYLCSSVEHGTATDLQVTSMSPFRMWSHQTTMGQNFPTCADPESGWDSINHTFTW